MASKLNYSYDTYNKNKKRNKNIKLMIRLNPFEIKIQLLKNLV
jgi:hypothetical protein